MTDAANNLIHFPSPYLNVREAAQYLNVSASLLNNLRLRGGGPVYRKHATSVRYARADLDAWSDARKQQHTSQAGLKQGYLKAA